MRLLLTLLLTLLMVLPVEAASPDESEGYAAFKQFLETPMQKTDRMSMVQFIFNSPLAKGEITSYELEIPKKKLDTGMGSLKFGMTSGDKPVAFEIPFHFVTKKNAVQVYFKLDDEWKKSSYENVEVESLGAHAIAGILSCVSRAEITNEDDTRKAVRVSFNGETLATLSTLIFKDAAKTSKQTEAFVNCIGETFRKTGTIDADFVIDKSTQKPLAIFIDVSKLFGNMVNSLITNFDEAKLLTHFGEIASQSELRFNVVFNYDGDFDVKAFEIPREARKAKELKTENTKTR